MEDITTRPIGGFFKSIDVSQNTFYGACLTLGTWFNQHYTDPSVLRQIQSTDADAYFDGVTRGILYASNRLVTNWQREYSTVNGEEREPSPIKKTGSY